MKKVKLGKTLFSIGGTTIIACVIVALLLFLPRDHSVELSDIGNIDVSQVDDSKKITPAPNVANIDAVLYETVSVEENKNSLTPHVIANGTSQEVAQFALQYEMLVKDMNDGIEKVTTLIYKSQFDYEDKQPSWIFKDGTLSELEVERKEPIEPDPLPNAELETDIRK